MKQASSDLYTQTASACGKGRRAVTDSGSPSLRLGRLRVTYLDISPLCSWDYGSTLTMIEQQHPVMTHRSGIKSRALPVNNSVPRGLGNSEWLTTFSMVGAKNLYAAILLEICSILPDGLGDATAKILAITST